MKSHRSSGSTLFCVLSMLAITHVFMRESAADVFVSNPEELPPAGSGSGWIDAPCTQEVRFIVMPEDGWVFNSTVFTGVVAAAQAMAVSDISQAVQITNGSNVTITFNATLRAELTELFGAPVGPLSLALPGSMTVVLSNKAGNLTGNFPIEVQSMLFSGNVIVPISVRQDPSRRSTGQISIHPQGAGYRMLSGLNIYSQFSMSTNGGVGWLPYVNDVRVPTHYELEQRYQITTVNVVSNGQFSFQVFGNTGSICRIESADQIPSSAWITNQIVTSSVGPVQFTPLSADSTCRYYRVIYAAPE